MENQFLSGFFRLIFSGSSNLTFLSRAPPHVKSVCPQHATVYCSAGMLFVNTENTLQPFLCNLTKSVSVRPSFPILAVFEVGKSSNIIINDHTMGNDEVVASHLLPRHLFLVVSPFFAPSHSPTLPSRLCLCPAILPPFLPIIVCPQTFSHPSFPSLFAPSHSSTLPSHLCLCPTIFPPFLSVFVCAQPLSHPSRLCLR